MKSEHRHELHTNELAKWISEFPEYVQRNQKMIIYIAVVIVLVIISAWLTVFKNKGQALQSQAQAVINIQESVGDKYKVIQSAQEGTDSSMLLSSRTSKLIAESELVDNPNLKALIYIKAADLLRAELMFKAVEPEKPVIENQLKKASEYYNTAIKLADENKNLVAMAKLGLGLCQEDIGNFDEAAKIYSEIATDSQYKASGAFYEAGLRLATIGDYKTPVAFAPAPPKPQVVEDANTPELAPESILEGLNIAPAAEVNAN
jgi:tetratricopeptide (TPR) repeat protein